MHERSRSTFVDAVASASGRIVARGGGPRTRLFALAIVLAVMGFVSEPRRQSNPVAARANSPDGVWTVVPEETLGIEKRTNIAGPYAVLQLNKGALDLLLETAPRASAPATAERPVITLPLPAGGFRRFTVEETATVAPSLSAAYPEMKTYRGDGLDDRTSTAAFGWTSAGFHAAIFAGGGSVYIDPYAPGQSRYYVSYKEADLRRKR